MKRRAAAPTTLYAKLCERLGVEPKQFAVLTLVAGGAIALLAGKMLLTRPSSASAAPKSPKAAAPATPSAPPRSDAADPVAEDRDEGASEAKLAQESGRQDATLIRLDTTPKRDPFRPFIERPKAAPRDSSEAPPDSALKAPDLTLFQLRATMDTEWVVINGQTLRKGEVVGLAPDGTPIKLREVGHRSALLEWRGKTFEINFTR